MKTRFLRTAMFATLGLALAGPAYAQPPADPPPTTEKSKDTSTEKQAKKTTGDKSKMQPKLGTAEVMTITQTAMTHVTAATRALERGDSKAARAALDQSERALARLYEAPALDGLMKEFDESIAKAAGIKTSDERLDLAPLRASVGSYRAYLDPGVVAGVEAAEEQAKQGDATAAAESLRLARDRMSVDLSFLPVEQAYTRVLAAQEMLDNKQPKQAARILQNVPIVVSQLQISQPLVPVRFKLQAAAEAAEAERWDRAKQLLSEVNTDLQRFETASKQGKQIEPIANEVERLHQQAVAGDNPTAGEIRELAKRARSIGTEQRRAGQTNDAG